MHELNSEDPTTLTVLSSSTCNARQRSKSNLSLLYYYCIILLLLLLLLYYHHYHHRCTVSYWIQ